MSSSVDGLLLCITRVLRVLLYIQIYCTYVCVCNVSKYTVHTVHVHTSRLYAYMNTHTVCTFACNVCAH